MQCPVFGGSTRSDKETGWRPEGVDAAIEGLNKHTRNEVWAIGASSQLVWRGEYLTIPQNTQVVDVFMAITLLILLNSILLNSKC